MFSKAYQPSPLSLFSSTGSEPDALFSFHIDPTLPVDSFILFLNDATPALPPDDRTHILISNDDETGHHLDQTVLHIQSPTLPTTYIRCPPLSGAGNVPNGQNHLGIKHPWIHLQVKNLGREWSFEVGVVDKVGAEGIIRCSTFQVSRDSSRSSINLRTNLAEKPPSHFLFRMRNPPLAVTLPSCLITSLDCLVHHCCEHRVTSSSFLVQQFDCSRRR